MLADISEMAWLAAETDEYGGGYDVTGWQASTWVLHAMWEPGEATTHAEAAPAVEFGELRFTSGGNLGWTEDPGPGWRRLRWAQLLSRDPLAEPLQAARPNLPSFDWLLRARSERIEGPSEGSLDGTTLPPILEHLCTHTREGAQGSAFAFWAFMANGFQEPIVLAGPLGTLAYQRVEETGFTPSNLWPQDRSWLLFTDYDLMATKISGSQKLIEALEADPRLETMRLPER